MDKALTFTQMELADFLEHDAIPGKLQNLWNSLVVNRQINSPYLMPWDSVRRTEFMVRLIQQGEEETIYRGDKSNRMAYDLKPNATYIDVSTGYSFSRKGNLTIGVNRTGIIPRPDAIGVLPPGPFFPTQVGVKQIEALKVCFDYNDRSAIRVSFDMYHLGLRNPETNEQAVSALRIIGNTVGRIKQGQSIDFAVLRRRLIDEAGLSETGTLNKELTNNPVHGQPQATREKGPPHLRSLAP